MIRHLPVLILQFSFLVNVGVADDPSFEKDLAPWLQTHCLYCHSAERQEGEFRIDTLTREVGVKDTSRWAEIIERINSGEMPPGDAKTRPSADENAKIVELLAARINEGEASRLARRDRVSWHRLTRQEYVKSVHDLIGVEYDAADPGGLQENPEWNGFERLGSVLTLSPTHIEKYMTAAEIVLAEAYPDKKVESLDLNRRAVEMRPGHESTKNMDSEHWNHSRRISWCSSILPGSDCLGPGVSRRSISMSTARNWRLINKWTVIKCTFVNADCQLG